MKITNQILFFLILIVFQIFIFNAYVRGQSVCQPQSAYEIGNFDILGGINTGCSPFKVELKDNSGGTNIRYDFYYDGKAIDKLEKVKNTSLSNFYFTNSNPKSYTLLQYGEKNGKPMFACKNITVLPANKPEYSYSVCSRQLEIVIPKNSQNNFDSYKIDWGSRNPVTTILSNQLPFSESKPVNYPTIIKVEGVYNSTSTSGCNLNSSEIINKLDITNFPNGIDLPFDPNIEEIKAINGKDIVLKFKGSQDASGYNLNRRPLNGVYTSNVFMINVLPGDIPISLPDSINSYCFYFTRVAKCGSFEESAEVCTIAQKKPLYNSGNIELSWSDYPTKIRDYVFEFNKHSFNKTISLEKELNGIGQTINVANTTFLDKVSCPKSLRYRVKIEISGLLIGYKYKSVVYSRWQEVDISQIKAKAITDLFVTVNSVNQPEILFINNANWDTKVNTYFLYEMTNNVSKRIDSSKIEFPFRVLNRNASDDSFCYKIGYVDDCGIRSDLSPEVCNLSLKLQNDGLIWGKANPFGDAEIKNLVVETKEDVFSNFQNLATLTSEKVKYAPNLSSFANEAFFRLNATDNRSGKISYSNSVEIPINNELYFPTVFSPNGDGKNDSFFVFGNVSKITAYSMAIYTRWGEKVYGNTDPLIKWFGKNQVGKDLLNGMYYCELKYVDKYKDVKHQKKEIFLLR